MKQLFILPMLFLSLGAGAQLGGLINRAKAKAESSLGNKVDKAIDKAINDLEGNQTPEAKNSTAATTGPAKTTISSYSKFDFVAGEKVIYSEDFSQDAIGELPVNWNASGKGEVVTLEGQPGKWLRLFPNTNYLSGNKAVFGENYTIEFDLVVEGNPPSGTRYFPNINFGLFATGGKDGTDNIFLRDYYKTNHVRFHIQPNVDADSRMEMESKDNGAQTFHSGKVPMPSYGKTFFAPAHYAIQVQKQRLRFWVNEQKYIDVPRAVNLTSVLNQLFLEISPYTFYNESNFGVYISNIKVATGLPDTRHKLVEEGKFSTTGILFDFQSAVIKPESVGVLKEIATVLKENPTLQIKVVGHTSSDGDDAANLELSTKRAAAVKEALVKEHGLPAERIKTEGKGETQPVADNKTKEGKVQNRRVEFVKI